MGGNEVTMVPGPGKIFSNGPWSFAQLVCGPWSQAKYFPGTSLLWSLDNFGQMCLVAGAPFRASYSTEPGDYGRRSQIRLHKGIKWRTRLKRTQAT